MNAADQRRTLRLHAGLLPALFIATSLICLAASGQARSSSPAATFLLDDASANWSEVGSVTTSMTNAELIESTSGTGVLVNQPTDEARGNLTSRFSHADIQLDVEVMLPEGTEAGIFLQGRYELQLADSWGATSPAPTHFGSILGVKPPSVNVARAPGLWQKLSILFRAPRFDAAGNKVANASFVRVTLNGTTIQEEVEVESPTDGAPGGASAEVASAPLVLQGGGGPVAFRNIQYGLLNNGPVSLENLTYAYYRGDFGWELPEPTALTLKSDGAADAVTSAIADTVNKFAINFEGDLVVPATGTYQFEVTYTGQFALVIDGKTIVDIDSPEIAAVGDVPRKAASTRLTAGRHKAELLFARGRWHVALTALGLYVSGPGSIRTRLSAPGSDPDEVWAAFKVDPDDKPRLQRSFVMHPSGERVHAISVGYPNGNHFAYDTGTGALLSLWRGRFIDTSTMWFSRGNDQSAAPQGSLIEMSGRPTAATSATNRFESPVGFRFDDYRMDDEGNPTFNYHVDGWSISDKLEPDADGRYFVRTLKVDVRDDGPIPLSIRLADATVIRQLSDNVFDVGDGTYRVELVAGSATIVESDGVMQLVSIIDPADKGDQIVANIVW